MRKLMLMVVMAAAAMMLSSGAMAEALTTEQILEHIYGGDFTDYAGQGWANYQPGSNGAGVTATQLDNTPGAGSTNLLQSTIAGDELWDDGIARFGFKARYAGYRQELGFFNGHSGGSYHKLADGPDQFEQIIDEDIISHSHSFGGNPALWRWARSGYGGTYSSLISDNPDNYDHMITYLITFDNGYEGDLDAVWILCWEDLPNGGDKDYNDLVVEVQAAMVPLPASAWAGLALLGGMGIIRKMRRR